MQQGNHAEAGGIDSLGIATHIQKGTKLLAIKATKQKKEETLNEKSTGGTKRIHVSENSDSDKEVPSHATGNEIAIVTIEPNDGFWRKVQKKKRKKEKLSDFYLT